MPPIARGQTWLFQPLPISTVPNTARNQSDSGYRGVDEDECLAAASPCPRLIGFFSTSLYRPRIEQLNNLLPGVNSC